jgi:hypothetical protein
LPLGDDRGHRDDLLPVGSCTRAELEVGVEEVGDVELVGFEALRSESLGDRLGVGEARLLHRARVVLVDDLAG